jgi:hypothetical protein
MRARSSSARAIALVIAVACVPSCRRASPPDSSQVVPSAGIAPATPSATGATSAAERAADDAPGGDAGVELGPSSAPDGRAREHAVLSLLAGGGGAESLPELATEPNTPLDPSLRDRLAPVQKGTGPRGVALIANVETSESVDNAARVIAGMRAAFRACYNRSLLTNPDADGSVRVRAQIAETGEVSAAKATPASALPPALIPCVEARVRAAQFAPPRDTKPATVAFQVRFYVEE